MTLKALVIYIIAFLTGQICLATNLSIGGFWYFIPALLGVLLVCAFEWLVERRCHDR